MRKKPDYLWHDRRRRLGMPLSFTRYGLSEDRLFLEKGLLSTNFDEILLYRVRDIGVGTITVQSSDKSLPTLELKNIKRPRETKELIHQTVEELKIARRMRVGETIYTHDSYDDHDDLIDHDDFWDDDHDDHY